MNTAAVTGPGPARLEVTLAITAFTALCVTVLAVAPLLIGPDGDAYRASIVAITDGHFLTLTTSQVHALAAQLARCPRSAATCLTTGPATGPGPVIEQWVRLSGGRWISEKNPGYLAARAAPAGQGASNAEDPRKRSIIHCSRAPSSSHSSSVSGLLRGGSPEEESLWRKTSSSSRPTVGCGTRTAG